MTEALFERDSELAELEAIADRAAAGRPAAVLLEGPAGIGKTRLLVECREIAAACGMRTLTARAGTLERDFPYGIVRQLFEPLVVGKDAGALLSGAAEPARGLFEPVGDAADGGEYATLHALYWLTSNVASESPLFLGIDDLQWCDRPSLRWLAFIIRRLEGMPILIAATVRDAEPGTDPALYADIAQDESTISLRPGPLTEPAVAELVTTELGATPDPAFTAACHAATGGNPLLLGQLLTALRADGIAPQAAHARDVESVGPRAVSRTVLVRLARLADEAVRVARAVAVLGAGADISTAAALAEVDEPAAATATKELARAEILRPDPPLRFVHPLVRDAVYQELSVGERELLHERAARILADRGATPEEVATHVLVMPRRGDEWAVSVLHQAGRSALAKGASDSAVAYLQRALDELPGDGQRATLLFELGAAEALGNGPAAVTHLQEAYGLLTDPLARTVTANVLARAMLFTGQPEGAAKLASEARAQLPDELVEERASLEGFEFAALLFGGLDSDELRERLRAARTVPEPLGLGSKMVCAPVSLEWMYHGGPPEECVELARAALSGGELIAADNGFLTVYAINTLALLDRDEAWQMLEQCLADAHRRGSLFGVCAVRLWRGYLHIHRGELADAENDLRTVIADFVEWGVADVVDAYLLAFLGLTLLEKGDTDGAWEHINRAIPLPGTDGARFLLEARTAALLAAGRDEEAIAVCEEIERDFNWVVAPSVAVWRSYKGLALGRLGRMDEALELLDEELAYARPQGVAGAIGRSLRIRGSIQGADGIGDLEEAIDTLTGSSARLELAKAHFALGSTLRRERKPTEARDPLRVALELAEACGADGLAEAARTELHASGARPRTSALSGVESLTASERRVAGLAAEGQTNRDIAQALFVTPKTVEVHLSNTYRKLGIRSRRELPSALAA